MENLILPRAGGEKLEFLPSRNRRRNRVNFTTHIVTLSMTLQQEHLVTSSIRDRNGGNEMVNQKNIENSIVLDEAAGEPPDPFLKDVDMCFFADVTPELVHLQSTPWHLTRCGYARCILVPQCFSSGTDAT